MDSEHQLPKQLPICPGSQAALDRLLNIALFRALSSYGYTDAPNEQGAAVSPGQRHHDGRPLKAR
jgi:hypothetical protein